MNSIAEKKNRNLLWRSLLIGLTAILVYANTFEHEFVLDDDVVFLKNSYVQEGISGIPDIFSHGFLHGFNQKNDQSYRPLVSSFFALAHQIFGNNAKALHMLTVFIYSLACILLYQLLVVAFSAQYKWLPFWASLIFVVHPIHTEVVANVKGMDEILHFIMAVSCLYFFLRDFDQHKTTSWPSLVFFALALLSKEIALSLLFLTPLSLWTFRAVKLKKLLVYSWPLGVVALFYFVLRNSILDTFTFEEDMKVINNTLAAAENYAQQLASTIYIFSEYIKLLFYPHPLSWDYSYPHFPIVNFSHWRVLLTMILFFSALVLSVKGIIQRKVWAYSFFFFCGAFVLTSNFIILIGATLGERFMFFPSVAFVIFLVWLIHQIINKLVRKRDKQLKIQKGFIVVISIVFAVKTFSRNKDWKNNETLFKSGVEATPNNSRAQSAIASNYRMKGESVKNPQLKSQMFEQAIEGYRKSITLLPSNASSWYNLGVTYMNMGNDSEAKKAFQKTIEIDSNYLNALNNLGVIHFRKKEFEKAEEYFKQCLRVNMQFQSAYANLGAVYHNQGKFDKARLYYEEALKLNPQDVSTRNNYRKLQN